MTEDSHNLILSPLSLDISLAEFQLEDKDKYGTSYDSVSVATPHGRLEVVREGVTSSSAPVLITFHDLGLNHVTNFRKLFDSQSMGLIMSHFTIYHVNAPGQEPGADRLSEDETYPDMEQLSESLEYICHHFGIASFIGIGSGFGANILIRLGKRRPKLVEGMVLFNADNQSPGWLEWGKNVVNLKSLNKTSYLPSSVVDFLVWFHFGSSGNDRCSRLVQSYKQYFEKHLHPTNLMKIIQTYNSRNTLKLARDIASNGKTILGANRTLRMNCLNVVGEFSPHVDSTVNFNGRLDPEKCTWMKINDASMVVLEQTEKVAQAIILFVQGLGYTLRKPLSN